MVGFDEIMGKAEAGQGLLPEEVVPLIVQASPEDWERIFEIARRLTQRFFSRKIYFYVPIYFSSSCVNDCHYCGYRRTNVHLLRRRLSAKEFLREADFLWREGHRNLLLVAGEHPILAGEIRLSALIAELVRGNYDFCLNAEAAPLSDEGYRILHEMGVRRCTLYQETYDRDIYARVHEGPKKDFEWRYHAMRRAMEAGIGRIGLGILLGLGAWQEDLKELIRHAWFLKTECGRFPVSLSFPRLRAASGTQSWRPEKPPVTDDDFKKIVAVTRLALPSVGINLTTREQPVFRDELLELGIGITNVSAGTSTVPGGYAVNLQGRQEGQFSIHDTRSLKEMSEKVRALGYDPVFAFEDENLFKASLLA